MLGHCQEAADSQRLPSGKPDDCNANEHSSRQDANEDAVSCEIFMEGLL